LANLILRIQGKPALISLFSLLGEFEKKEAAGNVKGPPEGKLADNYNTPRLFFP
jgi:hypothetical protein